VPGSWTNSRRSTRSGARWWKFKYFLGLTDQEAAEALGMKLRTLQRTWLDARRWLFARMESNDAAQYAGR